MWLNKDFFPCDLFQTFLLCCMSEWFVNNYGKEWFSSLSVLVSWVVRIDAEGHGFKTWVGYIIFPKCPQSMPESVLKITTLSTINTWKSAKIPKLSKLIILRMHYCIITKVFVINHWRLLQMTKTSRINQNKCQKIL